MKASSLLLQCLFFCLMCFPVAAKERPPVWVMDRKSAYPDSAYIAQRGTGKSAEMARTDALAAIARYLKSEVQATLSASLSSVGDTERAEISENVSVVSQTELYGTEFTEPYLDKKKKTWYCLVYIDRAKAWGQMLPDIQAKEAVFLSFMEKAQLSHEPFLSCCCLKDAWESAHEFFAVLAYGRLINSNADKLFAESKKHALSVPSLLAEQKKNMYPCGFHVSVMRMK